MINIKRFLKKTQHEYRNITRHMVCSKDPSGELDNRHLTLTSQINEPNEKGDRNQQTQSQLRVAKAKATLIHKSPLLFLNQQLLEFGRQSVEPQWFQSDLDACRSPEKVDPKNWPKSPQFIIWEPETSVPNFTAIRPVINFWPKAKNVDLMEILEEESKESDRPTELMHINLHISVSQQNTRDTGPMFILRRSNGSLGKVNVCRSRHLTDDRSFSRQLSLLEAFRGMWDL